MGMRPVSVGTRREGNQLHVTVSLERPLRQWGDSVDFDPPIAVTGGDTVHFEIRAEHMEYHGTGMSASSSVQRETVLVRQDSEITRLFGY